MKKLLSLFLCAVVLSIAQGPNQAPKRAPGFCLADTTGQWRDLAEYRGKVVIVEFMQTTCSHCEAFRPVLAGLQKKYGAKLQILSIAMAPADTFQTLIQYDKEKKPTWPVLFDMGQVAYSYV